MAKKSAAGSKKTSGRRGVSISVWVPVALKAALQAQKEASRRSQTTEVIMALEYYLAAQGFWPPPTAAEPAK
jgi:hypothetical protein